jgi:acetylornithine deacetylase/succinyl-diaminopimelate desuccinylase-like protein
VWAVWEGDGPGKTLLFEAHTDVVTEGAADDWEHPPFAAERTGGRVYGRGACDTKGNLAAAVLAVRAIKDSGISYPGRIVLCHPVDEEGMMAGIKAFVRGGHAEGVDAAVICEPEENRICVEQKGALRVEVGVRGRMAHGAMPLSGVNPVTRAARFVVAVEELEREEMERHGEHPFLGYPSLTPTIFLGPDCGEPQINVVPASAYVALDVRTTPAQSHEDLVGKLEAILSRLASEDPDFDATLEVIEERPRRRRRWTSPSSARPRPPTAGSPGGAALRRRAGRHRRDVPARVGRHPDSDDGGRGPRDPAPQRRVGGRGRAPRRLQALRRYRHVLRLRGGIALFDYGSMFDLTGKTALVVGAGSGIGEASARGLAPSGPRSSRPT